LTQSRMPADRFGLILFDLLGVGMVRAAAIDPVRGA
jgi:hypothetical protein